MAFIRKKRDWSPKGWGEYYYLVENSRENGRVKQTVLVYLGTNETVEDALRYAEERLRDAVNWRSGLRRELADRDGCGLSLNLDFERCGRKIAQLERWIARLRSHLPPALGSAVEGSIEAPSADGSHDPAPRHPGEAHRPPAG
jgi:hypothetical protein